MLPRSPVVCVLSHPHTWQKHQAVVHRLLGLSKQHFRRFCVTSSNSPNHSSSSSETATTVEDFSSGPATMVAVDITKQNFQEVLPAVKQALERCTFFAVDCEMTGLHTDGFRHEYLDDHQARCAGAVTLQQARCNVLDTVGEA